MRTEASVSSRLLAIAREASAELSDVASEPERERPMGACIHFASYKTFIQKMYKNMHIMHNIV